MCQMKKVVVWLYNQLSFKLRLKFTRFVFTSVKYYHHPWVVMVVKLSTSSPSTPMIWVQLPLKSTIFIVIFKRSKINEIEAENGPFYKTTLNSRCHFSFHFSYLHFDFVTASKKLFYTSPSLWNENFVRNICVSLNVLAFAFSQYLKTRVFGRCFSGQVRRRMQQQLSRKKNILTLFQETKRSALNLRLLQTSSPIKIKGLAKSFERLGITD